MPPQISPAAAPQGSPCAAGCPGKRWLPSQCSHPLASVTSLSCGCNDTPHQGPAQQFVLAALEAKLSGEGSVSHPGLTQSIGDGMKVFEGEELEPCLRSAVPCWDTHSSPPCFLR